MKRIAVIAFSDGNVSEGIRRLAALNPGAHLLLPWSGLPQFSSSIKEVVKEEKLKYRLFTDGIPSNSDAFENDSLQVTLCKKPNLEILREITPEDTVAIVWDDSSDVLHVAQSLEDMAVDIWNVKDGLEMIQVDFDDDDDESDLLYEEMQEAMSNFIEAFAVYITNGVLNTLSKAVEERLREDMGKKDIDPLGK